MRKIFYDFEVFKHDWMVVLVDYDTRKGKVIINDVDMLKKFYNLFRDDIWVGYNSRNYDQHILKGILCGMNPHFVSTQIIEENKKGWQVVRDGFKIPFNNFDITTGFHSLKQLEGFLGSRIQESSVPFDIDRPLKPEEIEEVVDYCKHDVAQTIEVFENKIEEFESQLGLIEAFDLDMSKFSKTKAQLSAFILGAEKHDDRGDEFDFILPDTLKIEEYKHIVDWYEDPQNRRYKDDDGKKIQLKVDVAGVEHVFGYGGIHGSRNKYQAEGLIVCADIASMYPAIMIEYDFLSRNVKNPDKYREIRDTRLDLKRNKDPRQAPYKIVLNSTFGASKDQFNPLYDPRRANEVCIAGQLLLLDLIERVEPYCELIQSNTDGIFMKVEKESDIDVIKEIAAEWEKRTRLDLEWDIFEKIYQKDVNNYILIDKDGKYKSKGAYVKKLNNLDYDLPIVNKALVEYFINNTPIQETIMKENRLREFQKIVKVTNKYKHALHGDQKLPEKVLRVFADKREDAPGVFKVKWKKKDGVFQDVAEKIGNTPLKCFIDNDNVKEKLIPDYLDKDYYIEVAQKRLNDFLGISNKEKKTKTKSKK